MNSTFKSKALATVLALVLGGAGLHRFYLNGMKDRWGWLHAASLPVSGLLFALHTDWPLLAFAAPAVLSLLVASLETFVLGLTPDEKWDEKYNAESEIKTDSHWPIPAMMVLNLFYGATLLLTVIARAFDLVLTGGAYG
jgi:TM2 domain-containing membrane protein YozV